MAINSGQNRLRAWRFQRPAWIPIASGFGELVWNSYDPDALEDLLRTHPILFPDYEPGAARALATRRTDLTAGAPYIDGWGCVWITNYTGMVGQVTRRPLEDWAGLDSLVPPDPEVSDGYLPVDWPALCTSVSEARGRGDVVILSLPHGHTFLRLQDLRGAQNLMLDMMDDEPRLRQLVAIVEGFNLQLVRRFLELRPDVIGIPEDLGAQKSLVISPQLFRQYIKPSYLRMTRVIKQQGVLVHLHSDGYIMEILDDLFDVGVDILNLQDLVNGIDDIARYVKGRVAIDLDIDRQNVTVHGSPQDIDDLIHESVAKLGSPLGGLSLTYQPWPPTPIENMRAVYDALEKYCTYYS